MGSSSLSALISRAEAHTKGAGGRRSPAPVEQWNPEFCQPLDFVIKRDGTWFYEGSPIGRESLVQLFSTVLRKDADGITYLVTPVEKVEITVEDAPFVAVEMNVSQSNSDNGDQVLTFRTNVGDIVEAGPDNPIRFEIYGEKQQLKPYILVRGRLEALTSRSVMFELVNCGEEYELDGVATFIVRSKGSIFPIMPLSKMRV